MKECIYQGFTMRKEFINQIKEYIIKSGKYYNVSEFVREAVREKMERIDLCRKEL
jgi:Arc/MetJ-type ribon-helix-helix transcriptional regulator